MMSSWNPRQKAGHGNARPHCTDPYEEDEGHCNCIRQEWQRRERSEIFLRAENNILAQLRKSADHLGSR